MYSRILGIDYGDVRVGLAITDPLGITAQGMDTLVINNSDKVFLNKVKELIKEYNISDIVIGYPKNMDGTLSNKALKVDEIIIKLKCLGVNVHKVDERLTTVSSYRTMKELGISQKQKNKVADKLSAIYILESYINKKQ